MSLISYNKNQCCFQEFVSVNNFYSIKHCTNKKLNNLLVCQDHVKVDVLCFVSLNNECKFIDFEKYKYVTEYLNDGNECEGSQKLKFFCDISNKIIPRGINDVGKSKNILLYNVYLSSSILCYQLVKNTLQEIGFNDVDIFILDYLGLGEFLYNILYKIMFLTNIQNFEGDISQKITILNDVIIPFYKKYIHILNKDHDKILQKTKKQFREIIKDLKIYENKKYNETINNLNYIIDTIEIKEYKYKQIDDE